MAMDPWTDQWIFRNIQRLTSGAIPYPEVIDALAQSVDQGFEGRARYQLAADLRNPALRVRTAFSLIHRYIYLPFVGACTLGVGVDDNGWPEIAMPVHAINVPTENALAAQESIREALVLDVLISSTISMQGMMEQYLITGEYASEDAVAALTFEGKKVATRAAVTQDLVKAIEFARAHPLLDTPAD